MAKKSSRRSGGHKKHRKTRRRSSPSRSRASSSGPVVATTLADIPVNVPVVLTPNASVRNNSNAAVANTRGRWRKMKNGVWDGFYGRSKAAVWTNAGISMACIVGAILMAYLKIK